MYFVYIITFTILLVINKLYFQTKRYERLINTFITYMVDGCEYSYSITFNNNCCIKMYHIYAKLKIT